MTADGRNRERSRRRRGVLVGATIVLAVAITSTLALTWWLPDYRLSSARASWQPPPEAMFASSMREQPVPGWRINVAELGLPRTAGSGLAVSNDERHLRPLIGNIGTNAYFLGRSGAPDSSLWWLVGLDVRGGRALFDAVPLGVSRSSPGCFLNGSSDILCVTRFSPTASAWVVDGRSGAVKYHGPTDLRLGLGTLVVEQVGMYAVARTQNEGVYGIGPRAETTWFVPGDGSLNIGPALRPGAASQTLTSQFEANPRTRVSTVFSVVDGSVIEPEIDEGATLGNTNFYTGGFVAEVARSDGARSGVAFFDDSGNRVGKRGGLGIVYRDDPVDLPVVSTQSKQKRAVFSAEGKLLLEVPRGVIHLVGTTLLVNVGNSRDFPEWQLYNMRDGTAGPVCDYLMHNYIGTDGSTLVFEVHTRQAEVLTTASDLRSCERVWTIPKRVDSLDRIWQIDGTLVQLASEGTELLSLVAPRQ